ncbi:MAG: hypothetical protein QXF82_09370 [Nitrososphaeria archaeon]
MTYRFRVTTERIVLASNLIVYRVDALLANIIDGILILGYRAIMDLMLEQRHDRLLFIISIPALLHIFYVIVYIINDLVDYSNPHGFKAYLDKSFYRLRPIYYFQRSKRIVAYTILLYVKYLTLVLMFMYPLFYPSIFFTALAISISIIHSLHGATIRVVTFYLLRVIKYVYMLILFNVITLNQLYDYITTLVISTLVIPYTIYSTVNYSELVISRNKITQRMVILIISFITLLMFFKVTPVEHQLIDMMKASITSYILIVIPIFGVRQILRRIFGAINPTYYHHLLRLILGVVLTLLTITSLFYILNYVMK